MDSQHDLEARLRRAARFFYALKDPVRLRILVALAQAGEMTVTELVRAVRLAQPLISWHLARLRAVGLVQVRRDGRMARYHLQRETLLQEFSDFVSLLNPKSPEEEQ